MDGIVGPKECHIWSLRKRVHIMRFFCFKVWAFVGSLPPTYLWMTLRIHQRWKMSWNAGLPSGLFGGHLWSYWCLLYSWCSFCKMDWLGIERRICNFIFMRISRVPACSFKKCRKIVVFLSLNGSNMPLHSNANFPRMQMQYYLKILLCPWRGLSLWPQVMIWCSRRGDRMEPLSYGRNMRQKENGIRNPWTTRWMRARFVSNFMLLG